MITLGISPRLYVTLFFHRRGEVRRWLAENNIAEPVRKSNMFDVSEILVEFADEPSAVAFKLRWL